MRIIMKLKKYEIIIWKSRIIENKQHMRLQKNQTRLHAMKMSILITLILFNAAQ